MLVTSAALAAPAAAMAQAPAPLPKDPLGSPMWDYHAKKLFAGSPVVFDERVQVQLPMLAENQHVLPLTVDARTIPDVQRIVIFADLNPIPVAVDYRPISAAAFIATRIKLDQRTPVRAAVLAGDGVWHVGGAWVDAAGGGCSAPPVSRVKGDWADHLGEMRGAAWPEGDGLRLRLGLRHPMDTGLVENIPAYNLDELKVTDAAGKLLGAMTIWGSVSEDPSFTLLVKPSASGPVAIAARDTNGREFDGKLALAGNGPQLAVAGQ